MLLLRRHVELEREKEMREQWRAGVVAVASAQSAKLTPRDFFPDLPRPRREVQSPDEIADVMRSFGRHIRPMEH